MGKGGCQRFGQRRMALYATFSQEKNSTMTKPTVLILRHMPHEPGGTLETALNLAGLDFRYFDLHREIPTRLPLDEAAGLVALGGPMNVDQVDLYPFLALDIQWIKQALAMELPFLGICLGAQLLAKTLGARVYPNRVKEIGWYPVELLPAAVADPIFGQSGQRMMFQWHGDTFDLPHGAIHLAQSSLCENQAFRYGRNAYGLQFHIEMTGGMIDDWLTRAEDHHELAQLDYIDPQIIRDRTPEELPRLQALAAQVFGRFAAMCQR
jgi:GMP synthase (glutamine-hydrolysing)